MKVTILGCGGSAGVPLIGCSCAVCASGDPRNKRLRASILIEMDDGVTILVDASPDLRQQALMHSITTINALILTHAHADHCHGLDDTRSFNYHANAPIDLYADSYTLGGVRTRFGYVFREHRPEYGWYKPCMIPHNVTPGTIKVAGHDVTFFNQQHGHGTTLGARIGNFAYSTDVNHLDDAAFAALEGVTHWVVDCLQYDPAPTHAHLALTLEWIERINPQHAVLTHMGHAFDYATLAAELPGHVTPAYDGLVLQI